MSAELKACPFCGGEAEFSKGKTGDGEDWHYVECGSCEAMGPHVEYAAHNIAVKEAIAEAWNRRADLLPPPAADYVAGLEAALATAKAYLNGDLGDQYSLDHFIRALIAGPASPDTRTVAVEQLQRWSASVNAIIGYEMDDRERRDKLFDEIRAIIDGGQDRG